MFNFDRYMKSFRLCCLGEMPTVTEDQITAQVCKYSQNCTFAPGTNDLGFILTKFHLEASSFGSKKSICSNSKQFPFDGSISCFDLAQPKRNFRYILRPSKDVN